MNSFVCVLLLAAVVAAEPPQYRFRFQRQEFATGAESDAQNGDAPYPAAGFRPAKEFNLPARQEASPPSTSYGVPDDSYGAPLKTFTAPQTQYGAPDTQYGVPEQSDSDDKEVVEVSTEQQNEEVKEKEENADKGKLEDASQDTEVVSAQGVYYVLLPNSQLQRVQFQTQNDARNMAYTARLQYRDEDRAPVYVYTAVPQYQSAAYVQTAPQYQSAAYVQTPASQYQSAAYVQLF